MMDFVLLLLWVLIGLVVLAALGFTLLCWRASVNFPSGDSVPNAGRCESEGLQAGSQKASASPIGDANAMSANATGVIEPLSQNPLRATWKKKKETKQ